MLNVNCISQNSNFEMTDTQCAQLRANAIDIYCSHRFSFTPSNQFIRRVVVVVAISCSCKLLLHLNPFLFNFDRE